MLPFLFVLLGENFFQPVRLSPGNCLIHEGEVVKHNEFFAATLTASIRAFKQKFNPKHFEDERVIDMLLWAFVRWANGALVSGQTVYS